MTWGGTELVCEVISTSGLHAAYEEIMGRGMVGKLDWLFTEGLVDVGDYREHNAVSKPVVKSCAFRNVGCAGGSILGARHRTLDACLWVSTDSYDAYTVAGDNQVPFCLSQFNQLSRYENWRAER